MVPFQMIPNLSFIVNCLEVELESCTPGIRLPPDVTTQGQGKCDDRGQLLMEMVEIKNAPLRKDSDYFKANKII